jgi:hypothetical protein
MKGGVVGWLLIENHELLPRVDFKMSSDDARELYFDRIAVKTAVIRNFRNYLFW